MKYRKKPVVIEAFQLNERGLVGGRLVLGCSDK